MIHVLHVVPGLGPAGMEIAMSRVVSALTGPDMLHSVVCLSGEAELRGRFPPSVGIYCLRSKPNDPALPWRMWRLLCRLRPTVIHARNWGAWPDVALARLATWPRIPLIFSFHGLTEYGAVPLRRRLAFRLLARLTTRLLTVSEPTKRMLVEQFGWPRLRVEVIPNGIDTERFSPRPDHRPPTGRLVIGTVGRLSRVKNHALLVRAVADLAARNLDLELRIAGAGPERDNLLNLAASLGVRDHLHLLGHVNDMPGFLRGLDIFVLPSASEAHPNALLEAMACGLPCVATDVGSVREVLDEGRAGDVVDPDDSAGMVRTIAALASDAAQRRLRGEAARQRVCTQYNLWQMIEAYAALYQGTSLGAAPSAQREDLGC